MSSMGYAPLLGTQGDKKGSIFINIAYNGNLMAPIDKISQNTTFINNPTFLKNSKKHKIYKSISGL